MKRHNTGVFSHDDFGEDYTPDVYALGVDIVAAYFTRRRWCHRRVEALHLLDGEQARLRITVDVTPPDIAWTRRGVAASNLLLLGLMKKQDIRLLDVRDPAGNAVPVATRQHNELATAAALAAMLEIYARDGVLRVQDQWTRILQLTRSADASVAVQTLISDFDLNPDVRFEFIDLAMNYLLLAVLDDRSAGRRTVLSYSYHLEIRDRSRNRYLHSVLAGAAATVAPGFGLAGLTFSLPSNQMHWAQSYQFECVAPAGLRIRSLRLPAQHGGDRPGDVSGSVVGHASARYDRQGDTGPIDIVLELDGGGTLPRIALWSLVLLSFYIALLMNEPLYDRIEGAVGIATTLLLSVPALLLGLSARGSENHFVSQIMLPLRASAVLLSTSLHLLAALLALGYGYPVVRAYAVAAVVIATTVGVSTIVGWTLLKRIRSL